MFLGVFHRRDHLHGLDHCLGASCTGVIRSKPLLLPGRHLLNLGLVAASIVLGAKFVGAGVDAGLVPLLIMAGIAGVLGVHLVMAIGGADMPVVVSMLNSYSGWAASAAGFMLSNDLLIITGALVGSSGAILSSHHVPRHESHRS